MLRNDVTTNMVIPSCLRAVFYFVYGLIHNSLVLCLLVMMDVIILTKTQKRTVTRHAQYLQEFRPCAGNHTCLDRIDGNTTFHSFLNFS